jgi:hypothetical protein
MTKFNHDLSSSNSGFSIKDAIGKYNSSNPMIVNLTYDEERQADGTMVATQFMVKRGMIEGREVIQVTFLGNGNLNRFTVLYPLKMAMYLAPAFMAITEGIAASNETNLNW